MLRKKKACQAKDPKPQPSEPDPGLPASNFMSLVRRMPPLLPSPLQSKPHIVVRGCDIDRGPVYLQYISNIYIFIITIHGSSSSWQEGSFEGWCEVWELITKFNYWNIWDLLSMILYAQGRFPKNLLPTSEQLFFHPLLLRDKKIDFYELLQRNEIGQRGALAFCSQTI